MKKLLSILLLSIVMLSNATITTKAIEINKEVSEYTVSELENVFNEFCKENNIILEKEGYEYEKYLREFLLQEEYSSEDVNKIKLIRAYAAIYINRDALTTKIASTKNKTNLAQKTKLETQTVGEIKSITEQEEKNNQSEKLILDKMNAKGENLIQPMYYSGYNPNLAAIYAQNFAINRNTNYADFTSLGGDCTNFVSQAIYAGGVKQVQGTNYGQNGWFYNTSSQRSATWTGANEFGNYWRSRVGTYSGRYKTDIIPLANKGDVIQYKEGSTGLRYHSIIVINKTSSDLTIAQRTDNYVGSWNGRGGIPNHGGYETYFDLLKFGY